MAPKSTGRQDWGALDLAQALFEREQAEIEALAEAGIDVSSSRLDADRRWANLATRTGVPERIVALLSARSSAGELAPANRAYLELRLAGAERELALRQASSLDRAREAFRVALAEPAHDPIDRVLGELWLAMLEFDDGRREEARAGWIRVGRELEAGSLHAWPLTGVRGLEVPRKRLVQELLRSGGDWSATPAPRTWPAPSWVAGAPRSSRAPTTWTSRWPAG